MNSVSVIYRKTRQLFDIMQDLRALPAFFVPSCEP
jgi:hypothetical protein